MRFGANDTQGASISTDNSSYLRLFYNRVLREAAPARIGKGSYLQRLSLVLSELTGQRTPALAVAETPEVAWQTARALRFFPTASFPRTGPLNLAWRALLQWRQRRSTLASPRKTALASDASKPPRCADAACALTTPFLGDVLPPSVAPWRGSLANANVRRSCHTDSGHETLEPQQLQDGTMVV